MHRTWSPNIDFRPFEPGTALYLQIAEQIIEKIRQGRLPPRTVMPGSRELAAMLNVNRKTIVLSYDELIAQGWLTTQHRRGTFVSEALPYPAKTQLLEVPELSAQMVDTVPSMLTAPLPDSHGLMSEGRQDKRVIPYEKFMRELRRATLSVARSSGMEYVDPKGYPPLRQAISALLHAESGVQLTPEQFCLTRNMQQSLYVVARATIARGDNVIFERLSSPMAREVFQALGANILYADLDEQGVDESAIEALCRRHPIKAVVLTPQVQYPTTVTLSQARRRRILTLAEQFDFHIVAVDHTEHFYFNRSPIPTVATGGVGHRIIHIGMLPHVLSPDIQVAYIANTPEFATLCAQELGLMDDARSTSQHMAACELIMSGEFHRIVRRLSKLYNARRIFVGDLLAREYSDLFTFRMPDTGLSFWLGVAPDLDQRHLLSAAATLGLPYFTHGSVAEPTLPVSGFLLGFSHLSEPEMRTFLHRLRLKIVSASRVASDS